MIKYAKLDLVIPFTQDSQANFKRMGSHLINVLMREYEGFNERGFKVLLVLVTFSNIFYRYF